MSISLPIIKSFVSVDALSKTLERSYRLRGVRCRLIQATMRDVYLVESTTKSYIACVYQTHQDAAEAIMNEVNFIRYLKMNGIPVAEPVAQANGEYLLTLDMPEGQRHVVMFEFVTGEAMSRQPDDGTIQRYGAVIAHIHRVSDSYIAQMPRMTYDADAMLMRPLSNIAKILYRQMDLIKELRSAVTLVAERLDRLDEWLEEEPAAYGIIHGDVIPSNVQIAENGALTIIDFDMFGYGWRMYDVASFLNEAIYWQMGANAEATFLQGYEAVRPLSANEKALLPVLGAARVVFSLGIVADNINTWGSRYYLSQQALDEMLRVLRHHLNQLQE